ncbi:hypothetical protein DB32_001132 [Sandaracinus amylolyticus]|uniref:Uncharacterized protein n=1 Tax=Sandaracinus amylolyticus TaxID=927083 RepID=A0A0F6W099_9BACT|nr:hypothetical protein DB32_001132 [Sandaracinus amylolyticus]
MLVPRVADESARSARRWGPGGEPIRECSSSSTRAARRVIVTPRAGRSRRAHGSTHAT